MKKKIDILICDSGMTSWQKEYAFNLSGFFYKDKNGHGTQMIEVMHEINPNAKIGSIKVLNKYKECQLKKMLWGLMECEKYDAKIIVLALAFETNQEVYVLKEIINELVKQGKIIVCSVKNGLETSYPAKYENVIGVRREHYTIFDENSEIQLKLNLENVICLDNKGTKKIFSGNSMAVAYVGAKISMIPNIQSMTYEQVVKKISCGNELLDL